jgi:nicotinamide-nucleotide adenylyltransferase
MTGDNESKPRRAMLLGRYQPLHYGHLKAILEAAEDGYEPIIVVGSADKAWEEKNPLTAGERIEMIDAVMREYAERLDYLDNYFVVPVPDIGRDRDYARHVEDYLPRFSIVYAGNLNTLNLFNGKRYRDNRKGIKKPDYPTKQLKRAYVEVEKEDGSKEMMETSGTLIRQLMVEGNDLWKQLTPDIIADKCIEYGMPQLLQDLKAEKESKM